MQASGPRWSPGYSDDVWRKMIGVQAVVEWHTPHSRVVVMWPAFLPVARTPSWQALQPVVIPTCENSAGVQASVEWQASHSAVVGMWLTVLPVASTPLWQLVQVPGVTLA